MTYYNSTIIQMFLSLISDDTLQTPVIAWQMTDIKLLNFNILETWRAQNNKDMNIEFLI